LLLVKAREHQQIWDAEAPEADMGAEAPETDMGIESPPEADLGAEEPEEEPEEMGGAGRELR